MRALTSDHMVASRRTVGARHARSSRSTSRASRASARSARAEFEKATGEKLTYLPFIIKAVVDGLEAASRAERRRARQRDHLPQADQHRHRRRARLGPHRSRDQERGRPLAHRPDPIAQRSRRVARASKRLEPRGGAGRRRSRSRIPASSARSMGTPIISAARRRSSASARSRSGRR